MAWLKQRVQALYEKHGTGLATHSAQVVFDELQRPGRNSQVVREARIGMFAFMLYDLAGKSTRMEQYSPILLADWRSIKTEKYLWGLSLNFMPTNVRIVFLDQLLSYRQQTIDNNCKASSVAKETPLDGITYEVLYKSLQSIGYEYALRQFDAKKITKLYEVSFGFLDHFAVFDTMRFTGVDEAKLVEIWLAKLDEQEERHKKMLQMLHKDYAEMTKTLQAEIKSAIETSKSLEKTAKTLRKMGGDI